MKKKKNRGGFGMYPMTPLSHREEYMPRSNSKMVYCDRKRRELLEKRKLEQDLNGY